MNLEVVAEERKTKTAKRNGNGTSAKELNDLKEELEVYKKRLAKMNSSEECMALIKVIQTTIQQYIETALKAEASAESLQKDIWSLCYEDFLIPMDINKWALERVANTSAQLLGGTSTACNIPELTFKPNQGADSPLFSKDTLYHASLCCHIVSTCDAGNFMGKMQSMSGHTLEEASMSVSETRENVDRYLIAKHRNTVYVAFQSEPTVSMWMEKYASFESGLETEMNRIPLRFFIEQMKDCNRIVLTGFSFGGLLACYIAANIWKNSYISIDELKRSVACISFGQPLVTLSFIQDVIKKFPTFEDTIHSIFDKEDIVPRLLRYFRVGCIHYQNSCSSTTMKAALPSISDGQAVVIPVGTLPASDTVSTASDEDIMGFKGQFAAVFLRNLAIIQEQEEQTYSAAVSTRSSPHKVKSQPALNELKSILKQVVAYAEPDPSIVCGTCYTISCEEGAGLMWNKVPKQMAAQELGFLSIPAVDKLDTALFKQHKMEEYRHNVFRSYLEKEPGKYLKPVKTQVTKQVKELTILKPEVTAVEFHEYPNEHVVVLEGNNLWFCHQIRIGETDNIQEINTPAQNITRQSIQFSFTPSRKTKNIVSIDGKVKIALYSHFANPIRRKITVKQEPYSFSERQIQLAKHTPSQIIQLALWSAMLECHPNHTGHHKPSQRFQEVIHFLQEVVKVVPIESIFHAVAYNNDDVALKCSEAIKASIGNRKIPPSEIVIDASQKAAVRMRTGTNGYFIDHLIRFAFRQFSVVCPRRYWLATKLQTTRNNELKVSAFMPALVRPPLYSDVIRTHTHTSTYPVPVSTGTVTFNRLPPPTRQEPPPLHIVNYLEELSEDIASRAIAFARESRGLDVVCNLNIEQVYPVHSPRRHSVHVTALQSPDEVLKKAREKLATYFIEAQEEFDTELPSNDTKASNQCMLELVKDIHDHDFKICVALLGAFMEQWIHIPLLKSPADTAKVLYSTTAPVAMGVWALFSLSYSDLQQKLSQMHGNSLLVEIADYISGIFNQKEGHKLPEISDHKYAGKLQFLLQGIKKTVSCSSQYISYSLEHQLCENLKFRKSIPVKELIDKWDEIFKGDALSLVAKSHRPLIARWLKWTVLIHDLREALAKYTCVGVIGLVNSGKSQLVNTLFKVQTLVGTTKRMRTTVPFMYNLDGSVDGLDVIDFPGVDDNDDSVPGLAKMFLSLAQVVIFVVDYRRIGTDAAKQWLHKLKEEEVPILVCLTHADRLYAALIPKDESETPNPTVFKQKQIGRELLQLQEEVGPHPSRSIKFYCFHQEPDSSIKTESLREMGIFGPLDVGDWLVSTFKNRLDQSSLADNLQKFIHGQ